MPPRVLIVAGEASGELYGSRLAQELAVRYPGIEAFGMGGPRMAGAGVELLRSITPVVGIVEVLEHLTELRRSLKTLKDAVRERKPDLAVLIDFPDFNLMLAREIRRAGVPVLYYVSPQIWAWRRGRLRTIVQRASAMAVILPFEEGLYREAGLRCEYVGHPLMEELASFSISREEARVGLGIPPDAKVAALLPGSRSGEIRRHWPDLVTAAELLKRNFPELQIAVPLASGLSPEARRIIENNPIGDMVLKEGAAREILRAADVAAVASGTAVLEAALIGVPTVVFYRTAWVSYLIARALVKLPFVSLPNLIAGKPVLREFLQGAMQPQHLVDELVSLLEDEERRRTMVEDFQSLGRTLGTRRASAGAADLAEEVAGW